MQADILERTKRIRDDELAALKTQLQSVSVRLIHERKRISPDTQFPLASALGRRLRSLESKAPQLCRAIANRQLGLFLKQRRGFNAELKILIASSLF